MEIFMSWTMCVCFIASGELHPKPPLCLSGQAYVACGDPAGSIKIVEVSQVLQQNPSPFSADFGIAIECKLLDVAPSSVDGKAMTSMKWVQAHGDIVSHFSTIK